MVSCRSTGFFAAIAVGGPTAPGLLSSLVVVVARRLLRPSDVVFGYSPVCWMVGLLDSPHLVFLPDEVLHFREEVAVLGSSRLGESSSARLQGVFDGDF